MPFGIESKMYKASSGVLAVAIICQIVQAFILIFAAVHVACEITDSNVTTRMLVFMYLLGNSP